MQVQLIHYDEERNRRCFKAQGASDLALSSRQNLGQGFKNKSLSIEPEHFFKEAINLILQKKYLMFQEAIEVLNSLSTPKDRGYFFDAMQTRWQDVIKSTNELRFILERALEQQLDAFLTQMQKKLSHLKLDEELAVYSLLLKRRPDLAQNYGAKLIDKLVSAPYKIANLLALAPNDNERLKLITRFLCR